MKVERGSASGNFEDYIMNMSEEEIFMLLCSGGVFSVWFNETDQLLCITDKDTYEG